ncbi:MAG TPA: LuxR C-terminal-related transcriptional regulator [Treponemataceae bacterium]|nr:LuxR C-terminal-related transcriptional regulator [Treponemataceae bacterium]
MALAAWLLALDLGVSVFSWRLGIPHHHWFKAVTILAQRASWTLVPLAGIAFTAPRKKDTRTIAIRIAFPLSAALTLLAGLASFSVLPSVTRIAFGNPDSLWIASNAYVSFLSFLSLIPDRRIAERATRRRTFAAIALVALFFASLPALLRIVSLDGNIAILAVSLTLSITIFISVSLAQRRNAKESTESVARRPDVLSPSVLSHLSAREIEIAKLLAEGRTNAEIADTLCISTKTVETHISNIFRKTGVNNRVQLARVLLSDDQG